MRERAPPRISTPPTYAQRNSPTYEPYRPESRFDGMGVWECENGSMRVWECEYGSMRVLVCGYGNARMVV